MRRETVLCPVRRFLPGHSVESLRWLISPLLPDRAIRVMNPERARLCGRNPLRRFHCFGFALVSGDRNPALTMQLPPVPLAGKMKGFHTRRGSGIGHTSLDGAVFVPEPGKAQPGNGGP